VPDPFRQLHPADRRRAPLQQFRLELGIEFEHPAAVVLVAPADVP
jgi:hypothetical protein